MKRKLALEKYYELMQIAADFEKYHLDSAGNLRIIALEWMNHWQFEDEELAKGIVNPNLE